MEKLKAWLYTIAIAIFSALLIAFAYDISNGEEIPESSTRQASQDIIVSLSGFLGITGSWIVGTLATAGSLYNAIQKQWNRKNK
ncbi:MAG: hypothetical protein IT261_08505 [Saprospiraceae bacterium]|nr:hypothetical protein [Saprospiraceae bacterium]